MRTNISTKFEGPNHKKVMVTLTFDLKGHLLFSSILPISLIVLGLIIANGFLLYVKKVTPHPPALTLGGASFHPISNFENVTAF